MLARLPSWPLILAAALATTDVTVAQTTVSKFGFQDVMLGTAIRDVPQQYLSDCGRPTRDDQKWLFCWCLTNAGAVPMSIEISFMNERVFQIHAYFPAEHFDSVWLALREKYGQESTRSEANVEWRTNDHGFGKPIPDEIFLRRVPNEPPFEDGTYIRSGMKYSVIEYVGAWDANEKGKAREEEQRRKIKGIADQL